MEYSWYNFYFLYDCCEKLYGTGIVVTYSTPYSVQNYLESNFKMKDSYMKLMNKYLYDEDVSRNMDEQINRMRIDPEYEQFVMSSFDWSPALWAIAKEIIGDKVVDLGAKFTGVSNIKEAIKGSKK
jgi:hypothetical protein